MILIRPRAGSESICAIDHPCLAQFNFFTHPYTNCIRTKQENYFFLEMNQTVTFFFDALRNYGCISENTFLEYIVAECMF